MTLNEIVKRIEEWETHVRALDDVYYILRDLVGADAESKLLRPSFALLDAYTKLVAASIGDTEEWLSWYWVECDLGKKPMDVIINKKIKIQVDSAQALAKAIKKSNTSIKRSD